MSDQLPYPDAPLLTALPECPHFENYKELPLDQQGNTPPFVYKGRMYQGFRHGTYGVYTTYVILQYAAGGEDFIAWGYANGTLQITGHPDLNLPPAIVPPDTPGLHWEYAFNLVNPPWLYENIHCEAETIILKLYRLFPDPIDPFPFYIWINFDIEGWSGRFNVPVPWSDAHFDEFQGNEFWVGIFIRIPRDVDFYHIVRTGAPSIIPLLAPVGLLLSGFAISSANNIPTAGRRRRKVSR